MNILLLGGGGREHALAWKLHQSPSCQKLYIAPGNAGTAACGQNVALSPNDTPAVRDFAIAHDIDLLIVGPEEPLVKGLVDALRAEQQLSQLLIIGPAALGAQLEGSKAFAKAFMQEYGIPTAGYQEFTAADLEAGLAYIAGSQPPIVLKADGLAAGKGVLICPTVAEAQEELRAMLGGKFGDASARVVVEDFLDGIEFSVFALTDGRHYCLLPAAKDYKRIGEGDTGLNTGGMGAVSPVPFADEAVMQKVVTRIVEPTIAGIAARGMDYCGFVFFGLILVGGEPFVIEYNCRMGDPETEVVMPRLKNDLVALLQQAATGQLANVHIEEDERAAVAVMLVAGGYPGDYAKGHPITGLEQVTESLVFHAGTRQAGEQVLTNGGRVLAVTTYGADVKTALATAQHSAAQIHFEGRYFRRDIGLDVAG